MNHETKEQAAITYASKKTETRYPKDAAEDFKAGASWREQQSASGVSYKSLDEWVECTGVVAKNTSYYFEIQSLIDEAYQSAQLSSAKLLAEKDAEIKMLRDLSVKSCVCLKLSDELSQAKELLVKKDAEIKKLNFIISFVLFNTRSNYVDKESRELFKKLTKDFEPAISWSEFVKENAEKIKALLGEEVES